MKGLIWPLEVQFNNQSRLFYKYKDKSPLVFPGENSIFLENNKSLKHMTLWKKQNKTGLNFLESRLGKEVYDFLKQVNSNDDFLTDYEYLKDNVKDNAQRWQLSDYSPLLLPLVIYYENSLWHVCDELELFKEINNNKKPYSLRNFLIQRKIK